MDHEPAGKASTVAKIERYMALLAQTLCYKVAGLNIITRVPN